MATVPYNGGVPEVSPQVEAPDDYQHIQASPAQFGALIGQGLEKAGEGAFTAAKFFGNVAADDAVNQYLQRARNILRGDPTKMVPGPDGKPIPDTGYFGLSNRAALDARPQVEQALDNTIKQLRSNLQTPQQQYQFDVATRRYRARDAEEIGRHADGAFREWSSTVNHNSATEALTEIANNPYDADAVKNHTADVIRAYVQQAQIEGASPGDSMWTAAVNKGRQAALTARLNAVAVKHPDAAMKLLDKNREIAGLQYDDLAASFRKRAAEAGGVTAGNAAIAATAPAQVPAQHIAELDQIGAPYGISGSYLWRTHQIEGNGTSPTGAQGPFQFTHGTAERYGLENPFDFHASATAAAQLAADNKAYLSHALGHAPSDAELYIAHQQGAAGAAKLLLNPNVRAGDLVGDRAIKVNGGDPNAPASAFTAKWIAKFNGLPSTGPTDFAERKAQAYKRILDDKSLTDEERDYAIKHVTTALAVQQIAEEATQKQIAAVSQQVADGYVKRILSGDVNGIPEQLAHDNRLVLKDRENVFGFLLRAPKADPAESVSGANSADLYHRIQAPDDDPGKIISKEPIDQAYFDQKITRKDHDWLIARVKDSDSEPAKRTGAFIKSVAPMIDAHGLFNVGSPQEQTGKLRLNIFQRDVTAKVQQYEKDGKDWRPLFDPASPDYLGRPEIIAGYQLSLQDVLRRETNKQQLVPYFPGGTAPLAPSAKRMPGESLDQWMRRTGHGLGVGQTAVEPRQPQVPVSR